MMNQFVIPRNCEIPKGAFGVWQIPELDIIMPVYKQEARKTAQEMVDREKCALIENFGRGRLISDHANSESDSDGRWEIGMVHPDMVAFFVTPKETRQYNCSSVYRVRVMNVGYLHDGQYITPKSSTDIMCRCCCGSNQKENYLAVFKDKGKMP